MWNQLIAAEGERIKFNPPLSEEWIDKGLADLDVQLNDSLKSLLLETNGVYDFRIFLWIVWNVRDLAAYNQQMWTDNKFTQQGMKLADLFFIANAGNDGILFAFPIVNKKLQDNLVTWNPSNNSRTQKSPDLQTYLKRWVSQNK